ASAERITVYCSPGDNALVASSKVNSNKRVGSCEKIPGVDMINVNQVDAPVFGLGHGYYSSRPVLTDLFQTILGIEARRRLFIRKSGPYNSEDYVLRK
ncbi:MAG TPA: alpha/beta hydrolase, partial [Leptospiraceae bacterium]|nr:alpha/beta hydrolase [Leptospiraceae bacterium]